jgi:hypothetical protein
MSNNNPAKPEPGPIEPLPATDGAYAKGFRYQCRIEDVILFGKTHEDTQRQVRRKIKDWNVPWGYKNRNKPGRPKKPGEAETPAKPAPRTSE